MGMARIQEYGRFMHMGSDLTEHTFEQEGRLRTIELKKNNKKISVNEIKKI